MFTKTVPCGIKPQLCDSAERIDLRRHEAIALWRGSDDNNPAEISGNLQLGLVISSKW